MLKKYDKNNMKNIDKIGIIMWGLLGDVLLRTPVVRALKEIYPNASIVVVVDPIGKLVLKHNRYIDDIIVVDRNKINKIKYNVNKIIGIGKIRKEKFDLFVNLYNGGSSPAVMFLSGARYKLGFCQQKRKFIYNVENICDEDRLKDEQTLNNYMISIIEPLSKKKFSLKPVFDISNEVFEKTKTYLEGFDFNLEKIYILNLGSGAENKILQNDKYFYIIRYIYDNYGFIPAIVSNPGQEYLQENFISEFMKSSSIPFIKLDTMPLEEVASSIKMTKFIITPDTGLMHLAMAFDNYIYTIFTYTHPVFVDPKNDKFIAVYEHFDEGMLYQHQNISQVRLANKIDLIFNSL